MQTAIPLLQNVRVASPCDASWEGMEAVDGERVKFCLHCAKNVYNLSELTQSEAEGLLRRHEGNLCVRYYQRQDGTVLTRDCPIGAQAVRMGLIRRSAVAAGLFTMLLGAMTAMTLSESSADDSAATNSVSAPKPPVAGGLSIKHEASKPPVVHKTPSHTMGAIKAPHITKHPAPSPPRRHFTMGKMKMPEHHNNVVTPVSHPTNGQSVSKPADSSDEAILKPQK